jgi:hypothetical protein
VKMVPVRGIKDLVALLKREGRDRKRDFRQD